MRPPARPPVPSAIDGYQRLRRGANTPAGAAAEPHGATGAVVMGAAPPRRLLRRAIGAARLAGMVAVLAIIVGASVGLASSGPGDPRRVKATAAADPAPAHVAVAVGPTRVTRVARTTPTPRVAAPRVVAPAARVTVLKAPVSKATTKAVAPKAAVATPNAAAAVAPVAAVARPRAIAPSAELPFTGDRLTQVLLLGGALLVLLGMLLQIAGQPLTRTSMPGAAPH